MAPAEGVGTGQSDDLLVVEAHAVEDVAEVVLALGGVGQAAVGSARGHVPILAAGAVRDDGAQHLLHGAHAAEDPQVRVGDPGELGCFLLSAFPPFPSFSHHSARPHSPFTGSRKSRAAFRPALAPWALSGAKRMVAPLLPPVPVALSKVPLACHARRSSTGP